MQASIRIDNGRRGVMTSSSSYLSGTMPYCCEVSSCRRELDIVCPPPYDPYVMVLIIYALGTTVLFERIWTHIPLKGQEQDG